MLTKCKNIFFQNSAKDEITHFNICVIVKSGRDCIRNLKEIKNIST